ncbi:MAG: type II secretion system protein M [Nevskiaceae bacterium]|nr:MAG: type II secretion system protein M [Nevskiaceae bacterium]
MNAYLTALQDWFRGLAARERVMVASCAVVVAVTVLFLGIWEPLVKAHRKYEVDLAAARALGQRLEVIAAQAQSAHGTSGAAPVATGLSLLSAVDQAGKSGVLTKPLTRIQPEGDNEVKVWIDGVSFDALLRWIGELELRYGIDAQSVDIEKDATPGQVNARLSLVRS